MSQYVVTDSELTAVANAIRTKGGTQANLEWYQGFVDAIGEISGGGGGGSTVTKVMNQGQVSTTSAYASATFSGNIKISDYTFFFIALFRGGIVIGYGIVSTSSYSFSFSCKDDGSSGTNRTYTFTVSLKNNSTELDTIKCTQYSGDYVNLYVDVYGIKL